MQIDSMNNTTGRNAQNDRRGQQPKSWGTLSFYSSSLRPRAGMIDDPSQVASIDAASSCIACCCIFV